MATTAPATRRLPLRTYQFRVATQGPGTNGNRQYLCGVHKVSGLSASVAPFEIWEGGNNLHRYAQPEKVTWEPITLEQGLALDETLEQWARAVVEFARTGQRPSVPVKRNVIIEVWDPRYFTIEAPANPAAETDVQTGVTPLNRFRRYLVHNAWISKYDALPPLDAMASEVGILSVELMHEGWTLEAPSI